jgi:hypothetical protein
MKCDWTESMKVRTRSRAGTLARTGRFVSGRVTAYRKGLLRRLSSLTIIVAGRPALLELLLERAKRLIGRPANGSYQSHAVLYQSVEILAHEPILQLHIGPRVRKPEEFLRRPHIGLDYAFDETGHSLLQILQTAPRGAREHHERAHILGRALNGLGHFAAELFELLGRVLNNLLLALGQVLRSLADAVAAGLAAAIYGIRASLADLASGAGGKLTRTLSGIAGCTTAGLDCLSDLMCGILLRVISHVFLL